jgi:hypothetical protein
LFSISGPQTGTDLNRIASALERIASSLEKLTGEPTNNPVTVKQPTPEPIKVIESFSHRSTLIPEINIENEKVKDPSTKLELSEKEFPKTNTVPKYDLVERYLNQKGINFQESGEQKPSTSQEKKLTKLASFLGQNYAECQKLYKLIKGKISTPGTHLEHFIETTATREKILEFYNLLIKAQILEEVTKTNSENKLQLKLTGNEQKYVTGGWLEYYAKAKVKSLLQTLLSNNVVNKFQVVSNIEIWYQNGGGKTEFDILFGVDREIFCIEAKTAPHLKDLKAKVNKMKSIGLSNHHMLILTSSTADHTCKEFSKSLGGVKVVGIENFEEALTSMIKTACEPPAQKKALV